MDPPENPSGSFMPVGGLPTTPAPVGPLQLLNLPRQVRQRVTDGLFVFLCEPQDTCVH